MHEHTKLKPTSSGIGKFYGRQDLSIYQVAEFNNRKEAWSYQIELQNSYGLKTDKEHSIAIGNSHVESGHLDSLRTKEHQSAAAIISSNKLRTCEYCGKENIKQITLNRWHGPSICVNRIN